MAIKLKFQKGNLLAYSFGLSLLAQLVIGWVGVLYSRVVNNLSPAEFPLTEIFSSKLRNTWIISTIETTLVIFLFWLFVRWVASTAERAGRSYLSFMLLAIFIPVVAWIVVIMFKKPADRTEPLAGD
jgi:hypothetical protein